ncbi:MAG: hypothetical protein PGN26_01310 [Xylophilus ampelinus]
MDGEHAGAGLPPELAIARVGWRACAQRQQDPGWRFSRGAIPGIHGWLVTVTLRGGAQGWGHVLATPIAAPDIPRTEAALAQAAPRIEGLHALAQAAAHGRLADIGAALPCVLSGLTSAMAEAAARALGLPLHALLGGAVRQRIPTARLVPIKPPGPMAQEARGLVAAGWRILKLKLDGRPDDDLARVRAVRAAVGPAVALLVDANQAYNADTAIDLCSALAAEGVSRMEQPVPAADRDGLRRVTRARRLPVEADESIGGSLAALQELVAMGAADSYNLKIPYFGGLRNTLAAARICEAAGVQCRLGALFAPRIGSAQAAHLAAVLPAVVDGAEIAESEHLLDDPSAGFDARDGAVPVLPGPGCGVAPRPAPDG